MALLQDRILPKFQSVESLISGKKVIAAYSGGADSTLVLLLCLKYAESVIPVFFTGAMFSESDLVAARRLCSALDIQLQLIDFNPLGDPDFTSNPIGRCYFCKKMIMRSLMEIKEESNYDTVVEGTNSSEIDEHRPGLRALTEFNVLSPLLECDFTKKNVRESLRFIAEHTIELFSQVSNSKELADSIEFILHRPSNACLCSRIDYGLKITPELLDRIQKAESFIIDEYGMRALRVRVHRNDLIRIEVPPDKIGILTRENNRQSIVTKLKSLGFKYITVDLQGFRSGSMNE